MSKLSNLIDQVNAAKVAFKEQGLELIKAEAKEFFEKNPDIQALSWVQYAPYFNDGDACEFSVHEIVASTGLADDEDDESFDPEVHDPEEFFEGLHYGEAPGVVNYYGSHPKHAGAREFVDLLQNIPEDVMRDLFGDDSKVLITRAGIQVDDYDHD
jgi:hypothetical protein